jgi:hypothetical protein
MKNLPASCHDCAEYGSEFCDDCIKEITESLPKEDRIVFNEVIRNIKGSHDEIK